MNNISKKCFEKLDLWDNPTRNPIEWFKRDLFYAVIICLILLSELPRWVLVKIIKLVCFIPWAIYEKLDEIY